MWKGGDWAKKKEHGENKQKKHKKRKLGSIRIWRKWIMKRVLREIVIRRDMREVETNRER